MNVSIKWGLTARAVLTALMICGAPLAYDDAESIEAVRWDILSLNTTTTPFTLAPGGVAFAAARNPSSLTIRLTGSGTFVAPEDGGTSAAVTGGGTWATFAGGTMTASGTYKVRRVVSWQFANLQSPSFIDLIDNGTRANGNAVLRIEYSDGSAGTLGVGCHGPGAPDGILEGVIVRTSALHPHHLIERQHVVALRMHRSGEMQQMVAESHVG